MVDKLSKEQGMLSEEELIQKVLNGEVKHVYVAFPFLSQPYYKVFPAHFFLSDVLNKTFRYPEPCLNFNLKNDLIPTKMLNFNAINDVPAEIDKSSFRSMSWLGPEYAICMGNVKNLKNSDLHWASPRNVLIKKINNIKAKHGVYFLSASELEFYVFKNTNEVILQNECETDLKKHLLSNRFSDYKVSQVMTKNEKFTKHFRENIINCGIVLEALFSEHGPGQHEINMKYGDILKNCDNHIFLKQCIKHTADQNGKGTTFMAKPFSDLSGSSCHVHISVYDEKTSKNIFEAPDDIQDPNYYLIKIGDKEVPCHVQMIHFIGGILKYLEELFICYAPSINSYKRFKKYSFAPCYINTWCYDSKLSSVKVIGEGGSMHLEVRVGGADVNPYVLHSALICSGMKGIEENLVPPEIQTGNTYEKTGLVSAPTNLYEATKLFEKSEFSKEIFGEDFKECIVNQSYSEWNQFMDHVSQWEVNRYMDLI